MLRKIQTVIVVLMMSCLVGCSQQVSKEKRAEDFIKKVITAPDEKIFEIYQNFLKGTDLEKNNADMMKAVEDFCGDYVDKETLEAGGALFQSVFMFQSGAASANVTYTVKSVKIEEAGEKNFYYEATVDKSSTEEPVLITGNIQFDDEDRINFLTILESSK